MKGFTLFFAMLVASLALAVGLAIFDLTIREIDLSATVAQSQYAIYAADTGVECALFLDYKFGTLFTDADGSAFATSSDYRNGGSTEDVAIAGQAFCNGQDIVTGTTLAPAFAPGVWQVSALDTSHATTTFEISLGAASSSPCAMVVIAKYGTPAQTTINSHGYNTCSGGVLQLERVLQVTY